MMNSIIKTALERVGIPHKYRLFRDKEIVPPPYITYVIEKEQHYGTDAENKIIRANVIIELITAEKDYFVERLIEKEFINYEFVKTENYAEDDEVFIITYDISIVLKTGR